jgi:transmembrane protein EpsG
MLIYWILFLVFFIFSAISIFQKNLNLGRVLLIFSFIILLVVIGLRDQTGSDWYPYLDFYDALNGKNEFQNNFEIGYYLFAKIFSFIGLIYISCFILHYF